MDREILFRGKRLDNGEWVYGYLIRHPSAAQIGDDCSPWYISVPPKDPDDLGGVYNVDPSTRGEYIGLTDHNGQRIFEGDLLKGKYGHCKCVKYGEFNCGCCYTVYGWVFTSDLGVDDFTDDMIVVGNIYDNPELLGGELQ